MKISRRHTECLPGKMPIDLEKIKELDPEERLKELKKLKEEKIEKLRSISKEIDDDLNEIDKLIQDTVGELENKNIENILRVENEEKSVEEIVEESLPKEEEIEEKVIALYNEVKLIYNENPSEQEIYKIKEEVESIKEDYIESEKIAKMLIASKEMLNKFTSSEKEEIIKYK